jgi:hypothetical protein
VLGTGVEPAAALAAVVLAARLETGAVVPLQAARMLTAAPLAPVARKQRRLRWTGIDMANGLLILS